MRKMKTITGEEMAQPILLKEMPPPGGKFRLKVISNMKNKLFLLSSYQEN